MKILIISDSHSRFNELLKIYDKEKPEIVIFAGDYTKDAIELSYLREDAEYYIVKGNCDVNDYKTPANLEFELEEQKIFLTHGHLFGVKRTYETIFKEAKNNSKDIVIFGHTHRKFYEKRDGIILFNPGAVKDGDYGILKIIKGKLEFEHKNIIK